MDNRCFADKVIVSSINAESEDLIRMRKRSFLSLVFSSSLMIFLLSDPNFTRGETENQIGRQESPKVLGNSDAPVKIVEYASFTCPHCATFHLEILPLIKVDYIDKGLVQLEYREVYFDGPGLWAGLLARCRGDEKYFPMIDLIFKKQKDWAQGNLENIKAGLLSIGRQAGLTDQESLLCMQDDTLAEKMVATFQQNATEDGISSTPSFVVNGKVVKNLPYEEFKKIIETNLK